MSADRSYFARRLVELIQTADVTWARLAQETGLHEAYLASLLRDDKDPCPEAIERLARYFEVPAEQLTRAPSLATRQTVPGADTFNAGPATPSPAEARAFMFVFLGDPLSEPEHAQWVGQLYDGRLTPEDIRELITERVSRSSALPVDKEAVLRFLAHDWRAARLLATRASQTAAHTASQGELGA